MERASDSRGRKGKHKGREGGMMRWGEARAWGFTCRYTLTHQCGYLGRHLAVPPRLTGCLRIVFEELHHLLNTLLPLCPCPCPNLSIHPSRHSSVHPGLARSDSAHWWARRWEMEGEGTPWGKEGCKDTLVVLLHSDAMLVTHARAYITYAYITHTQTHDVCKLTQRFWGRMDEIYLRLSVELK